MRNFIAVLVLSLFVFPFHVRAESVLDRPLMMLLPTSTTAELTRLLADCSQIKLNVYSPTREFISEAFFETCKGPKAGVSLFSEKSKLATFLSLNLSNLGLSLNMSEQMMDSYDLSPTAAPFIPLKDINFDSLGPEGVGDRIRKNLAWMGIHTVSSFFRAYRHELTLPEEKRWKINYGMNQNIIENVMIVIHDNLRMREVGQIPPTNHVFNWLGNVMSSSEDENVKAACKTLLQKFQSPDKL